MIREAVIGDEAALEGFLVKHFATTMFMRGNLRDFGIGNTEAPYGMRYFIREEDGEVTGVGGVGNGGAVMLQALGDLVEMAAHMRGQMPAGFIPSVTTGAPEMVAAIIEGFGLVHVRTQMNETEPLFLLEKAALVMPDLAGFELRASTMDDLPLMAAWNQAYHIEVLGGEDSAKVREETHAQAVRTIERGQQRLLVRDGKVVSQTNFNATLPDAVQVGGVFTPACGRDRGFSRRAVASHLSEAFAEGVQNAILFSASESASNVYRAIGFEQIGAYQIVLFE